MKRIGCFRVGFVASMLVAGGLINFSSQMASAQTNCMSPPAGLVGWWQGEGSAMDSAGTNSGVVGGGLSYNAGKVGLGFAFNGIDASVAVPRNASLDVGAGAGFTLEGWIKPSTLSMEMPIVEWDSATAFGTHFWSSVLAPSVTGPGALYANLVDTAGNWHYLASAAGLLVTNAFQHVALTYDKVSGMATIYLNGAVVAQQNLGNFTPQTSYDLYLGLRAGGQGAGYRWTGQMDEISLYARALSAAEIGDLFTAGSAGKCGSPIPPLILSQPASQAVGEGANVTFNVTAAGTAPLSYQWNVDGSAIPDATNASLTLTGVTTNQSGAYAVLVTNLAGAVLSSNANLTVRVYSPNLFDDFDPTIDLAQWASFGGTVMAANYGGSVSGSNSLWFGGDGSRYAITRPLNTTNGGNIQFYLRIANGPTYPWELADLPGEGIVLEYLVPSATNWVQCGLYNTSAYFIWTLVSLPIPTAAQAPNAQFRWRQLSNSGAPNDHWALDDVLIVTGPTPPVIVGQPQSQTVFIGSTVTLGVAAAGTPPLFYQWLFNGTNIVGATASSLVLSNVQPGDAGPYSVVVSNNQGTAASSSGVLSVVPRPPCASAPNGLVSWWQGENDAADSAGMNPGTLQGSMGFAAGEVGTAFQFNGSGARVKIPANPSLNVGLGSGLSVETWIKPSTTSSARPIVEWNSGTTFGTHLWISVGSPYGPGAGCLYGNLVDTSGNYHNLSSTGSLVNASSLQHVALTYDKSTGVAVLYFNGTIVAQQSLGTFTPQTSYDLYLGWRASESSYVWSGLMDEVSLYARALGQSEVQAIYNAGTAGKCVSPVAPYIITQPSNRTVTVGGTATMSVSAGGTAPLAFQWSRNSVEIAGATGTSLVFTNVQIGQAGSYSVVITNAAGSVSSSNATLTVNFPPAVVQALGTNAQAGGTVTVPIVLAANGNENGLGFSLNFNPTMLNYGGVTLVGAAAGATLFVNSSQVASGKLGLLLALPADTTFPPGTQEAIDVAFAVGVVTNATSTSLTFGDQPVVRQLSDAPGNPLPASFSGGVVTVAAVQFEADVSPRPNGDKTLTVTDWVLAGRYAARLDYPTNAAEFQRADCAPRTTLGDGVITVTDWVQAGRYAAGLDPLTPVGGPSSEITNGITPLKALKSGRKDLSRQLNVLDAAIMAGQTGTVSVTLQAQGNENALGFSLSFDPAVLSFTSYSPGSAASGATLNFNAAQAGSGRLAAVLALGTGSSFPSGTKEIVKLNFRVVTSAPGDYSVSFSNQPVPCQVSDTAAQSLVTTYANGKVTVNPLPSLRIAQSGQSITLAWPLWATNFVLQEANGAFSAGVVWSNLPGNGTVINNEQVVTLPLRDNGAFYRLRLP